jgi:hypothetical protein
MSPIGEFTLGLSEYFASFVNNDVMGREAAKRKIIHGGRVMIPYYGGYVEFMDWWKNKSSTKKYLAYPKEKK